MPFWHMLSLIPIGTPARGEVYSPEAIFFCTSSALCKTSSCTVTKQENFLSYFSI